MDKLTRSRRPPLLSRYPFVVIIENSSFRGDKTGHWLTALLLRTTAGSPHATFTAHKGRTMSSHLAFNGCDDVVKSGLQAYWNKNLPRLQKLLAPYRTNVQEIRLTVH